MKSSDNFKEGLIRNLISYKTSELKIEEDGVYFYRGNALKKSHILPKHMEKQNIIEQYRNQFYSSEISNIDFHRYFHHLNSSQALCINLFFPLIAENYLNLILEILEVPSGKICVAEFEKQSDKENTRARERRTSFDFYLKLENGLKIYFEIKYTENEFGKAKFDDEHISKYKDTYEPLIEKNKYINSNYKNLESFLNNYQIMRNLVHIGENEYVVFLFPMANKKINDQAKFAEEFILNDSGRSKFRTLYLDTLIKEIHHRVDHDKLRSHYESFEKKYSPKNET